MASNLAKILAKQWPNLDHLIIEKSRKRTNSNASSSSMGAGSNGAGVFGGIGVEINSKTALNQKVRKSSMQASEL